ncbi:MAG: glycerophosphodiester phosphodiesterase family protein [Paracoccaceae bacterium]
MTCLAPSFLKVPIAHRGLHDVAQGRAENSLSAVRAAIDAGYGIEIDIQRSNDGHAMVFHDYDLGRLTGETGSIHQRNASFLAEVTLIGSDDTIPTLAQVLTVVAGQVPVLIEIKDQDGAMGANTGPLEAAIAADLKHYAGDVAVMSFNPHAVAAMAQLLPDTPRGLVTGSFREENWGMLPSYIRDHLRAIPDFESTGSCFISHRLDDLDRQRVVELRSNGTPVLCWTVKSHADEAVARELADNITFEGYLPTHQHG